jgi:hypothetical protein
MRIRRNTQQNRTLTHGGSERRFAGGSGRIFLYDIPDAGSKVLAKQPRSDIDPACFHELLHRGQQRELVEFVT